MFSERCRLHFLVLQVCLAFCVIYYNVKHDVIV